MTSQPPSVPARRHAASRVPTALDAPRHVAAADARVATARRWAVGGLAVATSGLVVVVARLLDEVGSTTIAGVLGVVSMVLPGVLVGWCTAFATLALLVRDDLFHPRLVGLVAALVGTVLGAAVLPLAGAG